MRGSVISGERYIRKKHILLLWTLPKGPREKSVKVGKALYPGSAITEFHCICYRGSVKNYGQPL